MKRYVKEIKQDDVELIIYYFLNSDHAFLKGMGVDPEKLPNRHEWQNLISEDLLRPMHRRQFYYLLWRLGDTPIGHSNINKIVYSDHAYMHLHLWDHRNRKSGNGMYFIRSCINKFFETFELKQLFCEPYALNMAPNRTLAKTGFEFVKQYETTPGWINFHQKVNRWALSREKWIQLTERDRL